MAYNFVREPLNGLECDRLVNACITFREKLVVWTLLDTGLRVSEFCSLRSRHILWQENQIVVWGKTGRFGLRKKRRIVPLTHRVKRLIKKIANRALIAKPVTPHIMRHSFAVNCVKKGLSMASLRKILGHDRLETTAIYLNICPEDAMSEFFQKVEGNRS